MTSAGPDTWVAHGAPAAVTACLAAVAAALAVALLLPPRPRVATARARGWQATPGRVVPAGVGVVALLLLAASLGPEAVALTVVLAGAAGATARLWAARRAAREAHRTSTRVLETCERLAAELAAGRPPVLALGHAAQEWSALSPVAESLRLGTDVAEAWRTVARQPGAGDLRLLAAAWQVAHRTGVGLAAAVDRVAVDLRAVRSTERVVRGELASVRATVKLVAALPLLALAMGSGAGGDPWGFLLGEPVGLACLAAGVTCALAGVAWVEAIARSVEQGR